MKGRRRANVGQVEFVQFDTNFKNWVSDVVDSSNAVCENAAGEEYRALRTTPRIVTGNFGYSDPDARVYKGQKIAVYWESEAAWFNGTIRRVRVGSNRKQFVSINYEDGDKEKNIEIAKEKWRWLSPGMVCPNSPNSSSIFVLSLADTAWRDAEEAIKRGCSRLETETKREILVRDIMLLKPKKWLNCEIIHQYALFLMQNGQHRDDLRVGYVCSNVFTMYQVGNETHTVNYLREIKWEDVDEYVIPVHSACGTHWLFAYVVLGERGIYLIDPYKPTGEETYYTKPLRDSFRCFVAKLFEGKVGPGGPIIEWKYEVLERPLGYVQPPENTADCGVFVCWYLWHFVTGGFKKNKTTERSSTDTERTRKNILGAIYSPVSYRNLHRRGP